MDTASRTKSFIKNATFPCIAGNPPAEAFQPSGMKGIMLMVEMNDAIPPKAPSALAFLFQKPAKVRAPNSHSEAPRNQVAPRMPNSGYIQKIKGLLLINGINVLA